MTTVGVVAGAVAAVVGLLWLGFWRKGPVRLEVCERCGKERVLLDDKTDDVHLSETQRHEEEDGTADYHVWWCGACEAGKVVRHDLGSTSKFVRCEKCQRAAATEVVQTLKPATTAKGGEFRVQVSCGRCGHHQKFWRYTPRVRTP